MTTTQILSLQLPIRLPGREGVKALLTSEPSKDHHRALAIMGFSASRYSDERLGNVANLSKAVGLGIEFGNSFWKKTTISEVESETVLGDLLAHVRAYVPEAAAARMVGRALAHRGADVAQIGDDWVVWSHVSIEIR